MRIKVALKNIKNTPKLDEKIHEKTFGKLEKYLNGNTTAHWTCYHQEGQHHAEIRLLGPHFDYHASAVDGNVYHSLEKALGKIERQIWKKKHKMRNRIDRKNLKRANLECMDPEVAWTDYDEDHFDDVA